MRNRNEQSAKCLLHRTRRYNSSDDSKRKQTPDKCYFVRPDTGNSANAERMFELGLTITQRIGVRVAVRSSRCVHRQVFRSDRSALIKKFAGLL
jgi:hypothetical protein